MKKLFYVYLLIEPVPAVLVCSRVGISCLVHTWVESALSPGFKSTVFQALECTSASVAAQHLSKQKTNPVDRQSQFSSVQLLSRVQLFETPWPAACQASLFITNSRSLLKLMSIELVTPSNHLTLPLLSPSPLAFNHYQHQGLFKWVSSSHQVGKVLEFQLQHQSFQWIFRPDFL